MTEPIPPGIGSVVLQPNHVQPQNDSKSLNRTEYNSPPLAANVLAGLQLDNPLFAAE